MEQHNARGQFVKGTHWRTSKPFWEKAWLEEEYIAKQRSTAEIGADFGLRDTAIQYWLRKHGIQARSVHEARQIKHWGCSGEDNPMFGKTGTQSKNWKGGITPLRQQLYSSLAWARAVEIVWERDKGLCQRCGKYDGGEKLKAFHIHHIVHFSHAPLVTEPGNLVLLCHKCHGFVHSKRNIHQQFLAPIPETYKEP